MSVTLKVRTRMPSVLAAEAAAAQPAVFGVHVQKTVTKFTASSSTRGRRSSTIRAASVLSSPPERRQSAFGVTRVLRSNGIHRQDAKDAKDGAGRFPVVRNRRRYARPAPSLAILASWR